MSADARTLVRRCLDGLASDAEAAELSRRVATEPEVARQLAAAATFESHLEVVLSDDAGAAELRRLPARRRATWAVAGGIAAAAAAAAALAVTWSARHGDGDGDGRSPRAEPGAGATAPRLAAAAPGTAAVERAAPDPRRRLEFADGSTAELRDADSRVETRLASAAAIDLELLRGGARFVVTPASPAGGRRFRIWIGSSYIETAGAVFTADRLQAQAQSQPDAGARVAVERGEVSVISGQHRMRLTAGAAEVIPPPAPVATPFSEVDGRARGKPGPAAARAATAAPRDQARALLRASEEARRGGHPEEALGYLRRVVDQHPRDPRASYAAFILGRVLLEELARPREAAAAFARVAALDPRTPLVPDALAREVESWARAGDAARAGARAREYLARYPNGRRADEVRRYSRTE